MLRNRLVALAAMALIAVGGSAVAAQSAAAAQATSTNAVRTAGSVYDCMNLAVRLGAFYVSGSPVVAVRAALRVAGCGDYLSSTICAGTRYWGPFGAPFRWFVSRVTGGRYSRC